ncbi:hypothetical protein SK128_001959 [Halocaridina rubra]|uniref:Uncharacterized protein n=1 Tax=Halocaridina rubra TaxID=373956 RepID=A0AAN8WUW1_HALRR
MHRKAELRVATSLKRRRQSDEVEEDVEEEDDDGGHVDWAGQANKARSALLEADQTASGQELHYRLLLEDARTKTDQAALQADQAMKMFTDMQRKLVRRSFSALPPEKDRQKKVEELLQRQQQVEEQLKQARAAYFSLAIKKNHLEEEMLRKQEQNSDQVSIDEMLRLVVETEAFTEEIGVQENTLLTQKVSLDTIQNQISKQLQLKKEIRKEIVEAQEQVDHLKQQLKKKKDDLKELTKKQLSSRKQASKLKPSTRILSDSVLAKDLETKLTLKEDLEDELQRLKKTCGRKKITSSQSDT